jgi:hypothetical protein
MGFMWHRKSASMTLATTCAVLFALHRGRL